jgi:hypothetical protein
VPGARHHAGPEAVGDHLVGGVGGVVRVPEHEGAAVAAGPRVGQAQPPDLRVHVAAGRVRRREPCDDDDDERYAPRERE